jgi:uncharacterized Zn finger protein
MGYWRTSDYAFLQRPTVAARKHSAAAEVARLRKDGRAVTPVILEGRAIARTFWGKAWCQNLERYSDIANRLERGRSYVRSGSVVDLNIAKGRVEALVRGTSLYRVAVTVEPVESARFGAIVEACAGKIDSVIELLKGRLTGAVMELIASKERGLFPEPKQIGMTCSCPDSARMCKHVAAVLYGIGARFDSDPRLLFVLRDADPGELVASAAAGTLKGARSAGPSRALDGDLAGVFGIELDMGPAVDTPVPKPAKAKPPALPVKSPVPAKPATTSKRPKAAPETIRGEELAALGVPGPTVQYWLKTGVLERTNVRGVYRRTPLTAARLAKHRARARRG